MTKEHDIRAESGQKNGAACPQMTERADALGLPWDLTEWVENGRLIEWIRQEVETLEWDHPNLAAVLRAHPEFQPKLLLRLLLYAYAIGVFGSEDIVSGCYEDERLRGICRGPAPTRYEIVAFRRENRGLLKGFLMQLLKQTLRAKFGDFFISAGLKQRLIEAAAIRLDMARHIDRVAT